MPFQTPAQLPTLNSAAKYIAPSRAEADTEKQQGFPMARIL